MYVPSHYKNGNEAELLDFMKQNSFDLLISNGPEMKPPARLRLT